MKFDAVGGPEQVVFCVGNYNEQVADSLMGESRLLGVICLVTSVHGKATLSTIQEELKEYGNWNGQVEKGIEDLLERSILTKVG